MATDFTSMFNPYMRGKTDAQTPYARAKINIKKGEASLTKVSSLDFMGGQTAGDKTATDIGQYSVDYINQYLKDNELFGREDLNIDSFSVGGASGRSSALGAGLYAGGAGDFTRGAEYTGIGSMKDFDNALTSILKRGTEDLKFEKPDPEKEPFSVMPVPDDKKIQVQKRKQIARRLSTTGRASTILTNAGEGRFG